MPMDFTKSYGSIWGHEWAKYEQGGTLYDSEGRSYAETSTDRDEVQSFKMDPQQNLENAREFLQRLLKEGPMRREEIVKEAEAQGIPWSRVKDAAAEIKVQANKVRDIIMWRLRLE